MSFCLQQNAVLILETGDYFPAYTRTSHVYASGTLCFNTAMTGYQEAISDPSYYGQILVFSFPHVGNVGTNPIDMEASFPFLQGIVVSDFITDASNYRNTLNFLSWLKNNNIPCIEGVDTRTLIQVIRDYKKSLNALICSYEGILTPEKILNIINEKGFSNLIAGKSLLSKVSTPKAFSWVEEDSEFHKNFYPIEKDSSSLIKIVVLDFGVKHSILRYLRSLGAEVIVVPASSTYEDILSYHPSGIVFSNGPGDPRFAQSSVFKMMEKTLHNNIPILGICLGHQLLSMVYGAEIVKLPCGHHGINHPVQDLKSGVILITSQNHEYTTKESSLPKTLKPIYRSLFDGSLEGYEVRGKSILSVQFHPEAGPGPQDAAFILSNFLKTVQNYAQKN
ncbi:MAG: glutamine-hydrolyzing carbamoyl-phosphate synthase small subunit [Proteobacteria bacterium]|nr:glutamine-hydrolyzing carbamoyl-phosphate synthase small subunit [Pseudomonadota bacterium]